jgi:NADPH-dependent glutamate synthase beta subunit-like oxidoreductase
MSCCEENKLKGCLTEAQRCIQCYDAPCTKGCPAGIEVDKFIRLISKGDMVGAAEIIEKDNPFGLICGVICPHESLCQKDCTSYKLGRPIDIKNLQRYALETVRVEGKGNSALARKEIPEQRINVGGNIEFEDYSAGEGKIAVIGAGPSGLTCALYLKQMGYQVEIFEQTQRAGGRLTQGIPGFRINQEMLNAELKAITDSLTIHYDKVFGKDISLSELQEQGFQAIYLACGKWQEKALNIPGSDLEGVYSSSEILLGSEWKKRNHQKAAIIGAGNVAMDVAGTLVATGLEEIHVFFIGSNKEVTAWQSEREDAWQKGVIFHMLALPEAIMGELGKVKAIKFNRSKVLKCENGAWRVEPLENALDFTYAVDMVVTAIGFDTPQDVLTAQGIELNKTGHIAVDANLQTNLPCIFAGGDLTESHSYSVVRAVADGKKAALNIHKMMQKRGC